MKKQILINGITLLTEKKRTNSIIIMLTVKVGSNDEPDNIRGVSHFLEHLVFDGTKKRTAKQISRDIESVGGEVNAYTTNERTSFYVKVPAKYFDIGLDVISGCLKEPLLEKEYVEKERGIILSEHDMYIDNPMYYSIYFFMSRLFKNHNARYPVIGDKITLAKITRENIYNYFIENYITKNLIVTLVGDIPKDGENKVIETFKDFRTGVVKEKKDFKEPEQTKKEEYIEKRKIDHSYIILGYKVPSRNNEDSYVLDIMSVIFGGISSSRLFEEIRTKKGLGYAVMSYYEGNRDYGYFAAKVTADKKNIDQCKKIMIDEFEKIKNVTNGELNDAKRYYEGQYLLDNDDNFKWADTMASVETLKDVKLLNSFLDKIRKVTKEDINRVANKYFNGNHCCVILSQ